MVLARGLRAHSFPVETVHLHVRSGFSYGLGVATPEELVARTAELDMVTMALTDRDGLYGIPRFLAATKEHGVTPIVGAEVTVEVAGVVGQVVFLAESLAGTARYAASSRTTAAPRRTGGLR